MVFWIFAPRIFWLLRLSDYRVLEDLMSDCRGFGVWFQWRLLFGVFLEPESTMFFVLFCFGVELVEGGLCSPFGIVYVVAFPFEGNRTKNLSSALSERSCSWIFSWLQGCLCLLKCSWWLLLSFLRLCFEVMTNGGGSSSSPDLNTFRRLVFLWIPYINLNLWFRFSTLSSSFVFYSQTVCLQIP